MYLKDLRKMDTDKILKELNDAQTRYNRRFEIWKYTKDTTDNYFMNVYLRTINNSKKVLAERNLKVEFINGWEVIK